MRNERLDEELTQHTGDVLNLDLLGGTSLNPLPGLRPGLVQGQKTALASTLDQLIGLRNELGAGGQQPRVGDLGLVEDILDGLVIGEVEGGETSGRVVCRGRRKRSRLDDRRASEVVVEDGLAVGLEDGLGGHDVCVRVFFGEKGGIEELRVKQEKRCQEGRKGRSFGEERSMRRKTGEYGVEQKKRCAGDYSVHLGGRSTG